MNEDKMQQTKLSEMMKEDNKKRIALQSTIEAHEQLLQKSAAGTLDRSFARPVEHALIEVEQSIKSLFNLGEANFPDEFWDGKGVFESYAHYADMIARSWVWLKGDDLIEFSEAATILIIHRPFKREGYATDTAARVQMSDQIGGANPNLKVYYMPGGLRYPKRVSRTQVQALAARKAKTKLDKNRG